jgi:hypothetical protein
MVSTTLIPAPCMREQEPRATAEEFLIRQLLLRTNVLATPVWGRPPLESMRAARIIQEDPNPRSTENLTETLRQRSLPVTPIQDASDTAMLKALRISQVSLGSSQFSS